MNGTSLFLLFRGDVYVGTLKTHYLYYFIYTVSSIYEKTSTFMPSHVSLKDHRSHLSHRRCTLSDYNPIGHLPALHTS